MVAASLTDVTAAAFAQAVGPLAGPGRLLGCLLAVVVAGAGAYLIRRQWMLVRRPTQQLDLVSVAARGRWRTPTAILVTITGVLIFVGVWINPRLHPNLFVYIWSAVALVVVFLICVSTWDLLYIERQAFKERDTLQSQRKTNRPQDGVSR